MEHAAATLRSTWSMDFHTADSAPSFANQGSTPIYMLPSELLATILVRVHSQNGGSVICTGHNASRSLYDCNSATQVVSQVSRQFRAVAIGTPCLWANVYIRDLPAARFHVLQTCLERSQSLLLNIIIHDDTSAMHSQSYLPILLGHHHRWRTLSVASISPSYVQNFICMLQPLHTPGLESLTIQVYSDFPDPRKGRAYSHILEHGAPNLQILNLLNISILSCLPPVITLKNLTNWIFQPTRAMDFGEIIGILEAATSLTILKLSSQALLPSTGSKLSSINLPSLVELFLDFNKLEETSLLQLFTALYMPGLKVLGIRDVIHELAASVTHIIWSGSGSRYPLLDSLELQSVEFTDLFTVDSDRPLQSITSLALLDSNEDEALETAIASAEESNSPLWPRLQILKISNCNMDTLQDFIVSRIEAGIPISTLHFMEMPDSSHSMEMTDFEKDWLVKHVPLVHFLHT